MADVIIFIDKTRSDKLTIKQNELEEFKEISRKAAESMSLSRNKTMNYKKNKFAARGSAVTTSSFKNMIDESQQPKRMRRRSTLGNRQKKFWDFEDQVNLDDIHVMGSNDILERMKKYVNHEYEKARKGISKLRLKRYWSSLKRVLLMKMTQHRSLK
jgi:hypothetical protein